MVLIDFKTLNTSFLKDKYNNVVKNGLWSVGGGLFAFTLLFLANILAGRALGPEEFGKYTLIATIANILTVLFILDLDVTAIYFSSQKNTLKEKKGIIGTIIIIVFVLIVGIITSSLFLLKQFNGVLQINNTFFYLALLLALIISVKRITDGILKGLGYFLYQAIGRILEGLLVLTILLAYILLFEEVNYLVYIVALFFGGVVSVIFYFIKIKKYISVKEIGKEAIQKVFNYSKFGLINSFVVLVTKSLDKILIASWLGLHSLGLYAVYYTVSILLSARLVQLFSGVYFPFVNKIKKKEKIFSKINNLILKVSIPVVVLNFIVIVVLLTLFGDKYQFNWWWVGICSLYFIFHLTTSLYGWLLASYSEKGYFFQNISNIISVIVLLIIIVGSKVVGVFSVGYVLLAFVLARASAALFLWICLMKKDCDYKQGRSL